MPQGICPMGRLAIYRHLWPFLRAKTSALKAYTWFILFISLSWRFLRTWTPSRMLSCGGPFLSTAHEITAFSLAPTYLPSISFPLHQVYIALSKHTLPSPCNTPPPLIPPLTSTEDPTKIMFTIWPSIGLFINSTPFLSSCQYTPSPSKVPTDHLHLPNGYLPLQISCLSITKVLHLLSSIFLILFLRQFILPHILLYFIMAFITQELFARTSSLYFSSHSIF